MKNEQFEQLQKERAYQAQAQASAFDSITSFEQAQAQVRCGSGGSTVGLARGTTAPPAARGLAQECAELVKGVEAAENCLRSMHERLFGPHPCNQCEQPKQEGASISQAVEQCSNRLYVLCEELELINAKLE